MPDPSFNFFHHWYPISPVEDLDPTGPTSVTLLGQKLVAWKPPHSDRYAVFLDQCPHRLAPLSEGRIDEKTGHLMCSYHGWQFDSQGICTHIPQAENPEIITQNRLHYCVTALPTQQANGLLWVWPDANSSDIAKTQPLPLSPLIDASRGFVWSSMVRDLAYDWQTLIENVADPSHVPFAHHGVQGNRNQAQPLPMEIIESTQHRMEVQSGGRLQSRITFTPPCHLEYSIHLGNDRQVGLITYCLPVSPGKSRIVAQFSRNFAHGLHRWIPRWWNHIAVRNAVLDGDMVLLHHQERALQQHPAQTWKTAYKLPTSADRLVVEFRKWIDRYCGGEVPWGKLDSSASMVTLNRGEILDRYHQHTLLCSSCRQALNKVHQVQIGLLAYFPIAITIAAIMPDPLRLSIGLPFGLTALMGLGLYAGLKYWLEPKFYFVDYIHSKR